MTVLEVIQRSTGFLARKGVESPRLQSELLLAHVLQVPRLKLYLDFGRGLTEPQVETVRDLVKRRGNREPLQYILGSTSFCGLEIAVSPDVLIPRPETEVLAERGWGFLQARVAAGFGAPTALDLGTGSGCLAIALATHCPQAAVVATDLSEPALAVARRNAAAHRVTERIQFRCGDGFGPVPAVSRLDLIIANPPYIASGEIASLPPEVREHEPRMALDGGPDGLTVLRRLACEGPAYLAADGRLMTELADGQAAAARAVFAEQGWRVEAVLPDDAGCPRILIAGRAGA